MIARGQSCLRALYARPEEAIVIVTHSAFLRTAICQKRFGNADYRIFTFREDSENNELRLVEDRWTARNGGAMGLSPKGVQRLRAWDFPPEEMEEDAIE